MKGFVFFLSCLALVLAEDELSVTMQAPRVLRQLSTRLGRRAYGSHETFPATTLNDVPSPKGNWKTNYDNNQAKYNRHLWIGIVSLGGTLAWGQYNGYHRMYGDVPENPAVVESYIVEE
jgi:hypothetical protein